MDSGRSGHAIVLGAGMAGLLAARVLAEHYQSVTVLERDTVAGPAPRRGVPQGRHLHGLMEGGRAIIEALFPGLTAEAVGRGAPVTEVLVGSRWYLSGLRACPGPTGLTTLLASRPLLESLIRDRVTALPGVALRAGAAADGPLAAPGMITGVRVRSAGGGDGAELAADLVVDATGRASRAAQWLAGAARPAPATERVDVDLGYSSRTYRHRPAHLGGDLGVVVSTMPGSRGGGAVRVEGDRWHVTLGGMLGDHPPTDHAGFESWAATLPVPDIRRLVAAAEPLDDPVPHRFTGSQRHFFERLAGHPAGFLVLGDALCSFNPLYAQGMTVAAQQALALRDCLREGGRADLPRRFYARAAPLIDAAWQMSTNADLNHPGVHGTRTLRTRLTNAYVQRCHVAASADPDVARTFMRVANLVEPASVLLRPGTVARVLRQSSWPTTALAGKGNGDAKHRTRRGSADTRPGRVPADESGQQ